MRGGSAISMSRRWSSGAMRSKISPAKYANTASGVIRSPLSASDAPRWICSRIRMSPAAQPSARVQARSTIAGSPAPSSSAAASSRVKRRSSGPMRASGLVGNEARERGGRLEAADQDHVHADRDLVHHGRARLGPALGLVQVVEHDHGAGGQARKELAEPAPPEAGEIAPVLVGEERQRRCLRAAERRCGETEKVEERRGIAVARIDVVPDGGEPPRIEVAREQRAFSRARRTGDPQRGMLAPLVEQPEQALARADAIQPRARELCERRRWRRRLRTRGSRWSSSAWPWGRSRDRPKY